MQALNAALRRMAEALTSGADRALALLEEGRKRREAAVRDEAGRAAAKGRPAGVVREEARRLGASLSGEAGRGEEEEEEEEDWLLVFKGRGKKAGKK